MKFYQDELSRISFELSLNNENIDNFENRFKTSVWEDLNLVHDADLKAH